MVKCKPLTLADLVGGQHYIHVGVALDGMMWTTTFVFCGQPFAERRFGLGMMIRGKTLSGYGTLSFFDGATCYASDSGLLPERRLNSHRIFRCTAKNEEILRGLVGRGDLRAYLTLIGDNDPETTIARNKARDQELCHWDGENGLEDDWIESEEDVNPFATLEEECDDFLDDHFDDLADDLDMDRLHHYCR